MQEDKLYGADAQTGEVTADELEENLTEDAEEAMNEQDGQEADELSARVREGIAELFADGWTEDELTAFSQDGGARRAIAEGKSVARAACAYVRETLSRQAERRRGVPTTRTTASGGDGAENRIERMTDAQFDAFSRRAQEAMMAGKRVRM